VEVYAERCAGLDVHRDNVVATVRFPSGEGHRYGRQTRTFSTTLTGLGALAEWLTEFRVTLVGMEATGVYWRTVFDELEPRFTCWLLNAQHLRNVPGRKTDVKDSEWICELVAHGLVRPSFVPSREIRELRDLTRFRKAQIRERTRAMLEALPAGVSDPNVLADLAKKRMREKIPQLREALQGRFKLEHHGVIVAHLLAHIDTLDEAIAALDGKVEQMLAPHTGIGELLCTIPGVALRTAQVLIAECGLDMSQFPTARHFASWAGICPGHHESAGRRRSGRRRPRSTSSHGTLTRRHLPPNTPPQPQPTYRHPRGANAPLPET
jgi:transposase